MVRSSNNNWNDIHYTVKHKKTLKKALNNNVHVAGATSTIYE